MFFNIDHSLTALAAILLTNAKAEITIFNQAEGFLGSTRTQDTTTHNDGTPLSYDATVVDKLVVAVGTESGCNNSTDTVTLTIAQAPDTKKFARLKVVLTP